MVPRRALVLIFGLIVLVGGASLAIAQRPFGPGGGPPPFGGQRPGGGGPDGQGRMGGPRFATVPWIDVHAHLVAGAGASADYPGAVAAAITAMDGAGITKMVVMPPPMVGGMHLYDVEDFVPSLAPRARFAFLGGGGTLNPMIHDTKAEAVDDGVRRRFAARAAAILDKGAAGFGEMGVLHLSYAANHPYESVAADHPLFLLLADLAASRGALIDVHMDLVVEDMKTPPSFASPPNAPVLRANLAAFERLLEHNRGARIVWAHAGSDMLGGWTVEVSRRLLTKHPNLFMSLRMGPGPVAETFPLAGRGAIKPEWLALFQEFPDRFMLGADQFLISPSMRGVGPAATFSQRAPMALNATRAFLGALPPDLARKIGSENAVRLYKLD